MLLAVPAPSRPQTARVRGAGGFTLAEIVVVLTVMAILAGFGAIQMTSGLAHAKVRRAATILSADLHYAQGMAARQRRPVVVILNSSLRFYVIRDRGSAVVYRRRFMGDDTDYGVETLSAEPSGTIEVFPNGAVRTNTTFTVGLQDYERQVTLSRAGQIRLLPFNGS